MSSDSEHITLSFFIDKHHKDFLLNKIESFVYDLSSLDIQVQKSIYPYNKLVSDSLSDRIIQSLLIIEDMYNDETATLWEVAYLLTCFIPRLNTEWQHIHRTEDLQKSIALYLSKVKNKSFTNPGLTIKSVHLINKYYKVADLTMISNKLKVSKSYLSSMISENTSFSFVRLLNTARVLKAVNLIKENNHTSLEIIAESIGYNSIHYFNKVFKQLTQITPGQVKKFIQKNY